MKEDDVTETVDLLHAASHGDESAWSHLYERNRAVLQVIVNRRIPPYLRARFGPEDVLQSVFLLAFRKLPAFQYQGKRSFHAWLRGILITRIRDRLRQERLEDRSLDVLSSQDDSQPLAREGSVPQDKEDSPSQHLDATERMTTVLEALNDMSNDDQRIICMRYFDRLTWQQIAEELHMSEATARRHGFDATDRLMALLV